MAAVSLEKQALLTQEFLLSILHYDPLTGSLTWKTTRNNRVRIGAEAGTVHTGHGHKVVQITGREYQVHRLVWFMHYGVWPSLQVDHRDNDKTNNRISNLREATNGQNQANVAKLQRNNTSGVKGVQWDKRARRWIAIITVNRKPVVVYRGDSLEEAAAVRRAAEIKYFGEFAPALTGGPQAGIGSAVSGESSPPTLQGSAREGCPQGAPLAFCEALA